MVSLAFAAHSGAQARLTLVAGCQDGSCRSWDCGTGACLRAGAKYKQELTAVLVPAW